MADELHKRFGEIYIPVDLPPTEQNAMEYWIILLSKGIRGGHNIVNIMYLNARDQRQDIIHWNYFKRYYIPLDKEKHLKGWDNPSL